MDRYVGVMVLNCCSCHVLYTSIHKAEIAGGPQQVSCVCVCGGGGRRYFEREYINLVGIDFS